jgi:hypothetical protein
MSSSVAVKCFSKENPTKRIKIGKILQKSGRFELADDLICEYVKLALASSTTQDEALFAATSEAGLVGNNSMPASYEEIAEYLDEHKEAKEEKDQLLKKYQMQHAFKRAAFDSLFQVTTVGTIDWLCLPDKMSVEVFEFYQKIDEYKSHLTAIIR